MRTYNDGITETFGVEREEAHAFLAGSKALRHGVEGLFVTSSSFEEISGAYITKAVRAGCGSIEATMRLLCNSSRTTAIFLPLPLLSGFSPLHFDPGS